jgi:histone H2A
MDAPLAPIAMPETALVDAASLVSGGKAPSVVLPVAYGGKGGKAKGKRAGAKGAKGKGGKGGKASSGGKRGGKRAPKSRSAMAELVFPVGRMHSRMKTNLLRKQRCSGLAAVYLASVLEYLASEVLDLSSQAAMTANAKRITPRHILFGVRGDAEMSKLFTATIGGAGVLPQVQGAIKNKKASHGRKQKKSVA